MLQRLLVLLIISTFAFSAACEDVQANAANASSNASQPRIVVCPECNGQRRKMKGKIFQFEYPTLYAAKLKCKELNEEIIIQLGAAASSANGAFGGTAALWKAYPNPTGNGKYMLTLGDSQTDCTRCNGTGKIDLDAEEAQRKEAEQQAEQQAKEAKQQAKEAEQQANQKRQLESEKKEAAKKKQLKWGFAFIWTLKDGTLLHGQKVWEDDNAFGIYPVTEKDGSLLGAGIFEVKKSQLQSIPQQYQKN